MPFGLCNSPAIFVRFINDVFREVMQKGIVLTYMDDLIILAKDYDEAITNVKEVIKVAEEFGLDINWKKSEFLKQKVEYLGHIISNGTIRPGENKTKAVKKFLQPTTIKQIQQFLGLTGYFRPFIENYSLIAKPLSDLLRKDNKFVFGKEQHLAFEQLKMKLTENPVLNLFQFERETELHTDGSSLGYGAILMQKDPNDNKMHPIYYMRAEKQVLLKKNILVMN